MNTASGRIPCFLILTDYLKLSNSGTIIVISIGSRPDIEEVALLRRRSLSLQRGIRQTILGAIADCPPFHSEQHQN